MSRYIEHAKREFLALGYKPIAECENDPNKWIQENVLELLKVFSKQGHSGSSAPFCVKYFKELAMFRPLSPIKCTDNEWNEIEKNRYQNIRLSSVFKEGKKGFPYYLDAIVWRNQKGHTYTGTALDKKGNEIRSRQFIKLPFRPKTFYIDVIEKEIEEESYEFYIKNEEQLKPVMDYYQFQDLA